MDYINAFLNSHTFFNDFKIVSIPDDVNYRFQKRTITNADLIVSKDLTHISLYYEDSHHFYHYCYIIEDGKYVISDKCIIISFDPFPSICLELIDYIFGSKLRHQKRFHLIKEELIQETHKIGGSYYRELLQEGLKLWNQHTKYIKKDSFFIYI